jgi:hypothetical protein
MNASVCLCGYQEEYWFYFCQMTFPGSSLNVIGNNNKWCNCSIVLSSKSIIDSLSSAILNLVFHLCRNTKFYAQINTMYQESYDFISFNKLQLFGGNYKVKRSNKFQNCVPSLRFSECKCDFFCQSWIFTGPFNSAYIITTLESGDVKLCSMVQCHWTGNQNT